MSALLVKVKSGMFSMNCAEHSAPSADLSLHFRRVTSTKAAPLWS